MTIQEELLNKRAENLKVALNAQSASNTEVADEKVKEPAVENLGLKGALEELKKRDNPSLVEKEVEEVNDEAEEKEVEEKPEERLKKVDLDKNKETKVESKVKELDDDLKSHLDWLKEEEVSEKEEGKKEKKETRNYDEEISTYKSKVEEYESVLNDDLIKAVVEFRKNGGTDLSELSTQLGIVNPDKVSIEDFYTQEASAQGLSGQDLQDAVDEAVDSYKALPKLTQAKILNEFKSTLISKTEEKLKSFSAQNQVNRQEAERIQSKAMSEMQNEVKDKIGKKWRGLLIDEKMGKEILQAAPDYSLPIVENGRIVGYDSKHGVEMAIYAKFGKKLLKAQYDLASVSAYEKVISERNRPSENMTSNQIVVSTPNDVERISKARRDEMKKRQLNGRSN